MCGISNPIRGVAGDNENWVLAKGPSVFNTLGGYNFGPTADRSGAGVVPCVRAVRGQLSVVHVRAAVLESKYGGVQVMGEPKAALGASF